MYEYVMCPFGLKNGPSLFQRTIHNLFADLIKTGEVIHFLDDILVPSENIQDHLKTLAEVFRRLRDAGLEIRKEKCFFLQTEITYLGYKINQNEIRPTNEGVQGVVDFPVPTTTRKVHAFVGLAGYFRKFIRNFL